MITISLLVIIYIFIIKPNRKTEERLRKTKPFIDKLIAHRGLYAVNKEGMVNFPENSIPSFKRAVEFGYGIELDVRLTRDNKLVVFHDDNIKRMCGADKLVDELTYSELKMYSLLGTENRIPLFSQIMKEVNGNAPLLIEIKARKHAITTTKILLKQLKDYKGQFVIESFNPLTLIYLRLHSCGIIRGQLVMEHGKKSLLSDIFRNGMLLDFLSKPDFIASNHKYMNKKKYKLMRKIFDYTAAGWTIKSQQELEKAKKYFDIIIFDNFIPDMQEK